jgi:predicted alpha/beta-fold hydrolase
MSKIEVKSENRPMQTILPSFVTIVTFCHELTARMFGYPEKYEYLCNSKIKQ